MFLSYTNQPIDLHCKWTSWFLYDQDKGLDRVNKLDLFKASNKNIKRNNEYFRMTLIKKRQDNTAWKVSVFGIFLVRFFLIWTEYGDLRSKSPYSVRMQGNKVHKNSEYRYFSSSGAQWEERGWGTRVQNVIFHI